MSMEKVKVKVQVKVNVSVNFNVNVNVKVAFGSTSLCLRPATKLASEVPVSIVIVEVNADVNVKSVPQNQHTTHSHLDTNIWSVYI